MIGKFWAPSMAVIKISIVLFLKRILGSVRSYEITSYCLIAFIATWATTVVLVSIFQCTPIKYYYDQSSPGHCMKGQVAFFQANGAIALAEDVVILCMPIPIIWRLKITARQKIALTLVFSLGGLCVPSAFILRHTLLTSLNRVCIFSLLRLMEFRNFLMSDIAGSSQYPSHNEKLI